MKANIYKFSLLLITVLVFRSQDSFSQDLLKVCQGVTGKMGKWENPLTEWRHIGKVKLDSVRAGTDARSINLYFSAALSYYPLREENVAKFTESVKSTIGRKYRKYDLSLYSNGFNLNQLIPNIYRTSVTVDSTRFFHAAGGAPPLIKNLSSTVPKNGLYGKSITLWHSHGYYYEMKLDRWEWQRARLFGVVEDIATMGYVLPYLVPMLENAGATVFLPRERDTQVNEVIVDNDKSTGKSQVVLHPLNTVQKINQGFLLIDTLFQGVNPFMKGTSLRILNDSAVYVPEIPQEGYYAVSVSWPLLPGNSRSVKYTVYHSGGKSEYLINQTIGGKTWIYLGTFHFHKGINANKGSVSVSPGDDREGYIGLDAIRFGGGMGNVARRPSQEIIANQLSVNANAPAVKVNTTVSSQFSWKESNKPRFLEGARYWLQYAGMPDSLIYSPTFYKNDYNDDYLSRGAWVNYLISSPSSESPGLGIPVDMSLAFHTDAGITPNDSVVGTLAIYSTANDKGRFPDGSSRMASRDLSDIIQTQIVSDLRAQYDDKWTRRGLWDRTYFEARVPKVPAMLLELLSHQNQADQKLGLDPRFRFAVSRSIYKGMIRYQAYIDKREYIVQPLKVTHFGISLIGAKRVRLSWEPSIDTLEPTSKPERYRVYTRIGENGFDNGFYVREPWTEIELGSYDTIYSFRVTAINEGGESFPSEVLSVGLKEKSDVPILVVNGFDRVSGPEWFDKDGMAGVAWWTDRGVADGYEISAVGDQYDFDRKSPWIDDDSPGWGASWADMEGKIIPGNTFDFTSLHGEAIMASGHSFCSVSDEYFCSDKLNVNKFNTVDLIFGEEKSVPSYFNPEKTDFKIYTPELLKRIKGLVESGSVNIFISGAYIGSELMPAGDSSLIKFAATNLHFSHRTGHAVNNGSTYATDYAYPQFKGQFNFNTSYSPVIYSVEAPDAIEPAGKGSITFLRYSQNNTSAGVAFSGKGKTVAIGFPFETISEEKERNLLMKQILDFFEK